MRARVSASSSRSMSFAATSMASLSGMSWRRATSPTDSNVRSPSLLGPFRNGIGHGKDLCCLLIEQIVAEREQRPTNTQNQQKHRGTVLRNCHIRPGGALRCRRSGFARPIQHIPSWWMPRESTGRGLLMRIAHDGANGLDRPFSRFRAYDTRCTASSRFAWIVVLRNAR